MRVTVVSCWYPSPSHPSVGSFVERDVRALARDHQVRVVHLVAPRLHDGEPSWHTGTVPVLRLPMRPGNPFSVAAAARRLRPLLEGCDVVHTMAFPSAEPVRLLPGLGAPWVHTEHWSGIVSLPESRLKRLAARFVLSGPDAVTAVSSYLGEAISQLGRRDVRVLPNIVETGGYVPRRVPDGSIALVALGNLEAKKDPELAVRTVAELRRRGRDVTLEWCGDGPLLEQMQGLAARLGLADRIRFAGRVPAAAAQGAIARSDALLHTSTVETFSLVAAEALAAGRPVVIQATGGHRDFAAPPWAELVTERTPVAFADGVESVLASTADLDPEPQARAIAERFSEDRFRTRWRRLYEEVVA